MSKLIKNLIANELKSRYAGLDSALWIELVGVDGVTTNEFRRALHGKQMRIEIVRNALFRRAVKDTPLAPLGDAVTGPAAVLTGGGSLTDVAKLVEQWAPKLKTVKLRGAVLEGQYIDEKQVVGLAKMPTKRDLQGKVVGAMRSPGAKLAGALLSGGSNIAGCVKALIAKLEKEAAPAA